MEPKNSSADASLSANDFMEKSLRSAYNFNSTRGLSQFPVYTSHQDAVEGHETDELDQFFVDCRTYGAHGAQDYNRRLNLGGC